MLECLIIGDSIAVGVAQQRPECVSYSTGGLNTWQWNKKYSNKMLASPVVIISLGSNDHKHINTEVELLKMREKVQSQRVFWVLPAGNLKASEVNIQWIQGLVREIASKYGDVVLPITRLQRDGIHPSWAGYKELANQTR
jgi:lysophospholipase L1-like esterase